MPLLRSLVRISKSNIFGSVRYASSSTKREFKEVAIEVPWGHIAGKWWEPYDTRPILTSHGWQDNCQSFDRLIPLLDRNVGFLAIDLPGHGYSSRFPVGMLYHFTYILIAFKSISTSFGWPKMSLMGHSLGSVMSYIYSMLYPTEVDFLVCIDAAKPMVNRNHHIYFAKAIEDFLKYNSYLTNGTEPPSYTIEEVTSMITKPNKNSILPEYAKYIYERNILPSKIHPGKYYFSRDPRIKTGSMNTYSQQDLVELAQRMTMPIFIAKAKAASYYEPKENYYEVIDILKRVSADLDFHYVDGTHHAHLNNPECLSDLINDFIRRHNIEDRSIGGIKQDIIVNDVKKVDIV